MLDIGFTIQRNRVVQPISEQPEIVESKNMVGMPMRVNDGMDQIDFLAQQLDSQFRRRVDQEDTLTGSHGNTRASPIVVRIIGLADIAMATDDRYAMAGSRPEQYQFAVRKKGHETIISV